MIIKRLPQVIAATGRSRSSIYQDIAAGVFPPAVRIGQVASGWPDYEVEAVNRARIAGKTVEEIRDLVAGQVKARLAACDKR